MMATDSDDLMPWNVGTVFKSRKEIQPSEHLAPHAFRSVSTEQPQFPDGGCDSDSGEVNQTGLGSS